MRQTCSSTAPGRLTARDCLLAALFCLTVLGSGTAGAGPREEGVAPANIYDVTFSARLDPASGLAHVSLELEQSSRLVQEIRMSLPKPRYTNIRSDAPVDTSGERIVWRPGVGGSTLHYDVVIEQVRANGLKDTRITPDWALFKLDHLFPSAWSDTEDGVHAASRLALSGPRGWRFETPYGHGENKRFVVDNPGRRFDQPRGWAMAGKLAVRRDRVSRRNVSVVSPAGNGLRTNDTLSFLNWTLPALVEVFPQFPSRLLIVGGSEDMWRGGLSGNASLYMHPGRPLVSGNRTSTLLHELVHVASRMRGEDGADWIVEGIAEFYSLNLLFRSGGISRYRYEKAFETLAKWSAGTGCTATNRSQGKRNAAAALVLRDLDEEIRDRTKNKASLDTVVQNLMQESRTVSNAGFRAAAEKLVKGKVKALADCP